jgi:hypothetical protein
MELGLRKSIGCDFAQYPGTSPPAPPPPNAKLMQAEAVVVTTRRHTLPAARRLPLRGRAHDLACGAVVRRVASRGMGDQFEEDVSDLQRWARNCATRRRRGGSRQSCVTIVAQLPHPMRFGHAFSSMTRRPQVRRSAFMLTVGSRPPSIQGSAMGPRTWLPNGYPKTIRVDQGSEFVSGTSISWSMRKGATLELSWPANRQRLHRGAFNGRSRAACLNTH